MALKNSMKSSGGSAQPGEAAELEFPDLSGMDRFTPRLSAEAALRRNDEYLVFFQRQAPARQIEEKCEIEFSL
jgi:hypothetical protein